MARSRRPPGGDGAGGEGLGRSRGGFTTKLHLSADDRCRPLTLIVTPGQRADCTQIQPVLEKIRVPKPGMLRRTPADLQASANVLLMYCSHSTDRRNTSFLEG